MAAEACGTSWNRSHRRFETRLAAPLAPDAEAHRSLLLDSLDLDLTAALLSARQRQTLAHDLRLTLAELTLVDAPAARALAARAERADTDPRRC